MEEKKSNEASVELPDEALEAAAGGVQAGSLAKGGRGEFWSLEVDQLQRDVKEAEEEAQRTKDEKSRQIRGMTAAYGHEYF